MDEGFREWDGQTREQPGPAGFRIEFDFPETKDSAIVDAAKAVRQEHRDCSRWKRLRCRKVSVFSERDRGTVFVIRVGSSVEFDWTWEGAVAFRPRSIDEFGMLSDFALENTIHNDEIVWLGEILEVDEQNGCLFLSIENPERVPTTGSFFVRPFEFLAVLDAVYNDPRFEREQTLLPARLAASQGNCHPPLVAAKRVGEVQLQTWWSHSWSILWGPPGTGKTFTTGQQVASIVRDDPGERILVVSTTNRATDAAAIAIGNAASETAPEALGNGSLIRIGKGASFQSYVKNNLAIMLQGTESDLLARIDRLAKTLQQSDNFEEKAQTRKQIAELRMGGADHGRKLMFDPTVRVVISTAWKALTFLRSEAFGKLMDKGEAPFTTIFIDEAGLMSRAAIAALSLLAARRVVLVGDSKQLAPISRISRVLPSRQQTWLASSGLGHLDDLEESPSAVHVLSEQRRMHPDVCKVVSDYQYGGFLVTARERLEQESELPNSIADFSRAIWYVLDADAKNLASIRAQRGPGNKSWIRKGTLNVLRKLFATQDLQNSDGLFIAPYKAQAQMISKQFASWKLKNWEASTVHSQQGYEAAVVIFDTVNASSYNWPDEEWKRLVNVALSRAREAVVVLASQNEMDEPYLQPLIPLLRAGFLEKSNTGYRWRTVGEEVGDQVGVEPDPVRERKSPYRRAKTITNKMSSNHLGSQFEQRKKLMPVLSHEQQRLSNLTLDGKPRLVRGVAGSGKSFVLCNWLAKTVQRRTPNSAHRIWAVYANRSLHRLLRELIESAWAQLEQGKLFAQKSFPWEQVSLLHIKDVLAGILPEASLSMERFEFDYDRAAAEFLHRQDVNELLPRCSALFIDEAQDMGPSTLRLLLSLVEQGDPDDPNSRSAHIFFDNAQNIYGRKTPTWSDFGLDLRGRSTVMRESFRSTKPITEFAVNVLSRLSAVDQRGDQKGLLDLGLLESTERSGKRWWCVRYNQIQGPAPIFHSFDHRHAELERIARHLQHLTQQESVLPRDICVIYNGKKLLQDLERFLTPELARFGIEVSVQTNRPFERKDNTLVVTTSHSYKGYESEVVIIPGVDQYVTGQGEVLANNLYVAMTRARSLLALYGTRDGSSSTGRIFQALEGCLELLNATPEVDLQLSRQDEFEDLLAQIGTGHRKWLARLWSKFEVRQEPILDVGGAILAQPLFWFKSGDRVYACFEADRDGEMESSCRVITPGEDLSRIA